MHSPWTAAVLPPAEAPPLLATFRPHFTQPMYTRTVARVAAAIPTTGRRTIANRLRAVGDLAPGIPASHHRVLSAAR